MKKLVMFIFALALAAGAFAQTFPAPPPLPGPPPVTMPAPQPGGVNTVSNSCGPIINMVVGSAAAIIRACEDSRGGVSAEIIGGGFAGGYINDVANIPDGGVVILKDDGQIVRNRFNTTQQFEAPRGTALLRASHDQAVFVRNGTAWEFNLQYDGSLYSRPLWAEPVFPVSCTKVFGGGCFSRDYEAVYRSAGFNNRQQATPYFRIPGLTYVLPYRFGYLGLVRAQYDCGPAQQMPDGATLCYMAGRCKQTEAAKLVFVSGDNPVVQTVRVDGGLSLDYAATFTLAGDVMYVVETQYGPKDEWMGDFISKVDLRTGHKSVYLSAEEFRSRFGIDKPDIWLAN